MNKGLSSFLFIFVALFIGAMYYTNIIQEPFIHALNSIKSTYHNSVKYTGDALDKYFFQAKEIKLLKENLSHYEKNQQKRKKNDKNIK